MQSSGTKMRNLSNFFSGCQTVTGWHKKSKKRRYGEVEWLLIGLLYICKYASSFYHLHLLVSLTLTSLYTFCVKNEDLSISASSPCTTINTTRTAWSYIPCKTSPWRVKQPTEHRGLQWFSWPQWFFLRRCRRTDLRAKSTQTLSYAFIYFQSMTLPYTRTWTLRLPEASSEAAVLPVSLRGNASFPAGTSLSDSF